MKTSKFSESAISKILQEAAKGLSVPDVCRTYGISSATFYKWRSQFSGLEASQVKEFKELKAENARLKKLYAESLVDSDILREALAKKA